MTAHGKKIDDQECNITVDGSILKRVSRTTFLGIVLDEKLTWKNHILIYLPQNIQNNWNTV